MIFVAAAGCWHWIRGTFAKKRWLMWTIVVMPLAAMIANHAGWITAEVGRQPWIVYPSIQDGVEMMGLRTADGLSESVTAEQVLSSIILFGVIYSLLFAVWIFVLNNKIQHGPESPSELEAYKDAIGRSAPSDGLEYQTDGQRGRMMGQS